MRVACPRCGVSIEIAVRSFQPLRWATGGFAEVEAACPEWRDPANAAARASRTCRALDQAIRAAVGGGSDGTP